MQYVLCFLFLLISVIPCAAGKRVALVIGNSNYEHVTDLKNPRFDADLMEKTLRTVGFDVIRADDIDQRGMKKALLDYGRKLREGAETSMFFYAGHGIEVNGINYLVPVDADVRNSEEADLQNVSVNSFLALTENSGVPLNIIILDACRNNPFRSIRALNGSGLAPVKAPRGTYVAYATSPGSVASDGEGNNSPFTQALAESILMPGLTLEAVLKQTRQKVHEATKGSQLPYDNSAITGEFFFVPVVAAVPMLQPPLQPPSPQENATPSNDDPRAAYEAAGNDPALLRVVADKFAETVWGALARERLKAKPAAEVDKLSTSIEPKSPILESTKKSAEEIKAVPPAPLKKNTISLRPEPRKLVRAGTPPRVEAKSKAKEKTAKMPKQAKTLSKPKVKSANLISCHSRLVRAGMTCVKRTGSICIVAGVNITGGGLNSDGAWFKACRNP